MGILWTMYCLVTTTHYPTSPSGKNLKSLVSKHSPNVPLNFTKDQLLQRGWNSSTLAGKIYEIYWKQTKEKMIEHQQRCVHPPYLWSCITLWSQNGYSPTSPVAELRTHLGSVAFIALRKHSALYKNPNLI